jgi:hypothetical protein
MNGSSVSKPAKQWLQSSVQDFFVAVNWDDHPPEIRPSALAATDVNPEPFSLEMSVSRFFATINWDGNAIAAPTPVEQPKATPKNEFTLDDFSDLF